MFDRFAGLLMVVILAPGCGDVRRAPMPTMTPSPSPPASADYAAVGGVYRLTFDASPSCDLPEEARHRTYTAKINQVGTIAAVFLIDPQFYTDHYCGVMNRFDARVQGNTLFVSGFAGDCGIVELLPNSRFLELEGGAEATVTTDRITGEFNGAVSISSVVFKPTAICTAMDHRVVFERTE